MASPTLDLNVDPTQLTDEEFTALTAPVTGGLTPPDEVFPDFTGSDRLRPDGRPRREYRDHLRRISNTRNAVTVLLALLYPVAIVWAAITIHHPLAWIAAFVAMGTVFPRWAILHHEGAHRLLFTNRRLNDWVGQGVFGWLPFGSGSPAYRIAHASHHRDEFGPREPDLLLYAFYPISRRSLARKLARDAFFVSGYKNFRSFFRSFRRRSTLKYGLRTLAGQLVVLGAFTLIGRPELWVFLWLVPYMTYWRVANRLRALAEHGGLARSPDKRRSSHHVHQGFLPRLFIVPYNTGFHLAHHVDSGVPFRALPELHRTLVEDGYIDPAMIYPNYRTLWRAMVRS
ncbi:MAG TPA: hypothetical protein ENI86_13820 [Acidimicrobiales bacterium]|nr:hypothetical protein [Acidimicrobiales bacterium]